MLLFSHLPDCLVSSFLFGSFLGMSYSGTHHMTADKHIHGKAFIVIRAFFFYQMVLHKMGSLLLYDFLQDGLAIIKELFMFNIIQDKICLLYTSDAADD